ncbi:MAG: hypothetical protein ACJ75B_03585 [Flavisolibacter sp.]
MKTITGSLLIFFFSGFFQLENNNVVYALQERIGDTTNGISNFINTSDSSLPTGWYFIVDSVKGHKRILEKSSQYYYLDSQPFLNAKDIGELSVFQNEKGEIGLKMIFKKNAKSRWERLTEISYKESKWIGFVLDNRLLYRAIVVNGKLSDGIADPVFAGYTKEDVEVVKEQIQTEGYR